MQNELSNYNAWLNGLYVFNAVNTSIYNNFGRKETQQPLNYIEKPYEEQRENSIKEQLKRGKRALSKGVGQ